MRRAFQTKSERVDHQLKILASHGEDPSIEQPMIQNFNQVVDQESHEGMYESSQESEEAGFEL